MSARRFDRPAYEVQYAESTFPCLLACEHASNYIPADYQGLGLSRSSLEEHIAWDIGAHELLGKLAEALTCTTVASNYSRLLVDCNRPLDVDSLMPAISEATRVLGNENLSRQEIDLRIEYIYQPFHAELKRQVLRLKTHHPVLPVIGIHSFTPVYLGEARPWEFSLMWTKRTPFIDALIKYFEEHEMGDLIGFNEPYSASTICAYTTWHYAEHYGLPTAIFEVRQDLLTDSTSVEHWTHVIKTALLDVMRSTQLIS